MLFAAPRLRPLLIQFLSRSCFELSVLKRRDAAVFRAESDRRDDLFTSGRIKRTHMTRSHPVGVLCIRSPFGSIPESDHLRKDHSVDAHDYRSISGLRDPLCSIVKGEDVLEDVFCVFDRPLIFSHHVGVSTDGIPEITAK